MLTPPIPNNETERLSALKSYRILDTDSEIAFDGFTRLASIISGMPISLISLVDENRQWFKSKIGIDACETGRDESFCAHAILSSTLMEVSDTLEDIRFADNILVQGAPYIRHYVGAPLITTSGLIIGTLCIIDTKPGKLTEEQLEGLKVLAFQVMQQMELHKLNIEELSNKILLRKVLDAIPDLISYKDKEGKFLGCNSAFEQYYGTRESQIIGKSIAYLTDDESEKALLEEDLQVLSSNEQQTKEEVLRYPDGSKLIVESCKIPYSYGCDDLGMIIINRDITQKKQLFDDLKANELSLSDALKEAKRANNAKSEFLSSMSHELRTPMNAVLGFAQLLSYDDTLNADQLDNVKQIMEGGNHLLKLINEVLDLAKIESGSVELSIEPTKVEDVIEECFTLIQGLAANMSIQIRHNFFSPIVINTDRMRLKQVLLNLLSNAIKYNKHGGDVSVDMHTAQNDSILSISIMDTGIGISQEQLENIFLPFNRINHGNSNIEGTGIGLDITSRLLTLMGGTITVESELNVGSTFWIEIPITETIPMVI